MSFKELFENLPTLIELFIPGFVFLVIYNYFIDQNNKHFEGIAIGSIAISYILNLFVELIKEIITAPAFVYNIISIIFAFLCSILVVKLRRSSLFKMILIKIGKTTGNSNIWYDFFDMNKGTSVKFYCEYNNKNVTVIGNIKYFEGYEDGECNFVISDYEIQFENGDTHTSTDETDTMIFTTKNITGLEAHYGE